MSKEIKGKVKMQIPGGAATPAPPVGSSLGQHGVNLMDFCKQFNAKTADKKGKTLPVVVTIYTDKKFTFEIKTPQTSALIKEEAGIAKGSAKPNSSKVGKLSQASLTKIAQIKMPDLNAFDLEQAEKIVAGVARSMGIDIVK